MWLYHFYKFTMEFKSTSSGFWPLPVWKCFCLDLIGFHSWRVKAGRELLLLDGRSVWLCFSWKIFVTSWCWGGSLWNFDVVCCWSLPAWLHQYQPKEILSCGVSVKEMRMHFCSGLWEVVGRPFAWRLLSRKSSYKLSIKKSKGRDCQIRSDQDQLKVIGCLVKLACDVSMTKRKVEVVESQRQWRDPNRKLNLI